MFRKTLIVYTIYLKLESKDMANQNTQEILRTNERIDELESLCKTGIDCFMQAGKIVVEEISKNCNFPREVEAHTHGLITEDMVKQLEKVGLNLLSPKLVALYNKSKVSQKLSQLPVQLQEKYLSEPFDVLTFDDQTQRYQELKVKHEDLTRFQISQVFNGNVVRSINAQEAWIKSRKTVRRAMEVAVEAEYVICDGHITFRKGCKFKVDDIVKILSSHLKS